MKIYFSLLLVCLSSTLVAQIVLSGTIKDKASGEVLIGANIYALGNQKGSVTNVYGFYSLTIPAADTLVISYVGYETKRIFINASKTLSIELPTALLQEIEITATANQPVEEKIGKVNISVAELKRLPIILGETDIIKSLALTPGISIGTEGTTGLLVRGGTPDQNLVLLDGATVYNISHLFGFLSVFNPDAVKEVTLLKGAFPAEYGGRLSSVVDVRMKDGNKKEKKRQYKLGLISSSWFSEGPLNAKTSYMFSARTSYLGLIGLPSYISFAAKDEGQAVTYWMYDTNFKLHHQLNDKEQLFYSFYAGNDILPAIEKIAGIKNKVNLNWGNITSSIRYTNAINSKLYATATLAFNYFNYRLKVTSKSASTDDGLLNRSSLRDVATRYKLSWYTGANQTIDIGGELIQHSYKPGNVKTFTDGKVDRSSGETIQALSYALYINDKINLSRWLSLNLGLRWSNYQVEKRGYHYLEPRLSLAINPSNSSSVKFGYSAMNQFVHLLTASGGGLPNDIWVPTTAAVPPQRSKQYSIGYSQDLANQAWNLTIESYYKKMSQLIDFQSGASIVFNSDSDWQELIEQNGEGITYGGEFFLKKNKGRLTGWLGYTLSWNDRLFQNINQNQWFPAKYDRRHDFELTANYKISDRWQFSSNFVYNTGFVVTLPVALIEPYQPVFTTRNNKRAPDYLRLDVGFTLNKKNSKGNEVQWNFSLYNAFGRRNPFFVEYRSAYFAEFDNTSITPFNEGVRGTVRQGTAFSLLPSFSYSVKF
ncbi:MAG: carboxypeptidase-like regulatory domain-containing protein [Saprospiraceae bacterium]